ncbi:MAG: restriction endonuclease subunit S [Candidatus Competibacteraceae bacterium]
MKAGWQSKLLADVLQKTETVNPQQSPEEEFDYIDVSSVSNSTFQIEATQRLKGKDAPSRARKVVRTNDVLFATIRPTLQRIAIVPECLDRQVCSTGYFVLRPKPEVDYRYLFYSLFTESFTGQIAALQKGASYPAVTDGEVKGQVISFPPLPEQRRIIAILDEAFDSIATAKANAEKNLQNARALFESHLQSVFTERGEGWVDHKKPLADLCALIVDCEHKTAPTQEEGIPSIRTPNIGKGKLLLDGVYRVSEETYREWTRRAEPLPGDLILAREAPAGNVAVIPDNTKVCLGQRTVLIRPNRTVFEPEFLSWLLLQPKMQQKLLAHSRGATVQHVNMKDIRALHIEAIPPLSEQRRIVANVGDASEQTQRLESLYQKKLTALDALKKSLLHQAFSGKL